MQRWALVLVLALAACAPNVATPAEQQRVVDHIDGATLATQLRALPGVVQTEVALRRPAVEPLARIAPPPAALSMVIVVDDKADQTRIRDSAAQLARALAPAIAPTIVVEVGATRAELAKVGPFSVEKRSQGPLKATLAIALAAIAGLATWMALGLYRARAR